MQEIILRVSGGQIPPPPPPFSLFAVDISEPRILAIIVVTYNEARHVARLLRSIKALERPAPIQIETILVDGGSQDGTATAARAAGFDLVEERPGANIPVCRNAGAALAKGDWLAYVDGDCELAPDWLTQALPFLRHFEQVMLGWPARPPDPMNPMQAAWNFHWLNKNPRLEQVCGQDVVRHEGFRLATTRNMILTRAVFDAIGGFNEELSTGEDTDFAFRAYMADIPVLGIPSLRVQHHGEPRSLAQFYRQQVWHANRNSYAHIKRISGGRVGGNAPRFALAFLMSLVLALTGMVATFLTMNPIGLAAWLLPLAVVSAPAIYISLKGQTFRHLPMLVLLYTLYGWARIHDGLGLAKSKTNWKATAKIPV